MAGQARRGLVTAVEKIDPSVLADIVIKAAALQERANRALVSLDGQLESPASR